MAIKLLLASMMVLAPLIAYADYDAGSSAYDERDYVRAYQEWSDAAQNGDAPSLLGLGKLHEQGLGVAQNFIVAHMYYNLAGARGSQEARDARDALAARLTPELLVKAQEMATARQPQAEGFAPADAVTSSTASGPSRTLGLSWSGVSEASVAVLGDQVGQLKKLLREGTDPNVRLANGDTLLLQAVRNSGLATVDALLGAGADANASDPGGWTPLKVAIYSRKTDVVRRLLQAGADPSNRTPDDQTALALAQRLGQADMVVMLGRKP